MLFIQEVYCDISVYIPGKAALAQPIAVDTIPVNIPSQNKGPPESPCNIFI